MSSLRLNLIRLAHAHPEFRKDILPLISKSAMEHSSPEALEKYLKEHPNADKSKHTVKKPSKAPEQGAKPVKLNKALGDMLGQWHGSIKDPIYAVSSAAIAGKPVPASKAQEAVAQIDSILDKADLNDAERKELTKAKKMLESASGKKSAPKSVSKPKTYKKQYVKSVSEVMDKHSLTDEDASEVKRFKNSKPSKGTPLSDAALMQKFLAKASPETKERMKGMSVADFKAMYAAIMDEEGAEGGGKTASDKVAKLQSRQEKILQAYLAAASKAGVRAATGWDELPDRVRMELRKVKDQETLWMDVDRWFDDNAPRGGLRWAAWDKLPPGWTQESVQSFWDSLTGDVKHKVTKCMKEMEGKVDDTGAFCGSLGSAVGYRAASSIGDASLLRKAAIRVAHENPSDRANILPFLSKAAASKSDWDAVFNDLDAEFKSWNPNKVTDWNKVYKSLRGRSNDAGAVAHWYSEYRANRASKDEAIKALTSEGVSVPKAKS